MAEATKDPDIRTDVSKLYAKTSSFEERITSLEDALSALEESLGASANLLETLVEFKAYAQERIKTGGSERLEEVQKQVGELKGTVSRLESQAKNPPADAEKLNAELKEIRERVFKVEGIEEGLRKDVAQIDFESIEEYVKNLENSILKIIESQEKLQQKLDTSDAGEIDRKLKEWNDAVAKTDVAKLEGDVEKITKILARNDTEKMAADLLALKDAQERTCAREEGGLRELNAKAGQLEERLAGLARLGEELKMLQSSAQQASDKQRAILVDVEGIKRAQDEAAPKINRTWELQNELLVRIKAIEALKDEMESDKRSRQAFLETLQRSGFTAKSIEDLRNLMEEGARIEDSLRKYSTDKKLDVDLIVDSITRKTYDKLSVELNTFTNEISDLRNHSTAETNRIDSDLRALTDSMSAREEAISTRLGERIKDLNTLHNTLATDMSTLRTNTEGQLNKFGTSLRNLNEVIVGRVKLMDAKIGTNTDSINTISRSLRAEIDGIKEAVPQQFGEIEKKISDLNKNIGAEKVKELEDRVAEDRILIGKMTVLIKKLQETYNPTKINETRIKVERLESIINAIEGGKPEVLNKVANLEQQMAKIDVGRIMSLIDKIEAVKDEISTVSNRIAPERYHAKLNELENKVTSMESQVQDHSRIHETVQDLNVKLAVMKDHVKSIKDEVSKKKLERPQDRDYLVLE